MSGFGRLQSEEKGGIEATKTTHQACRLAFGCRLEICKMVSGGPPIMDIVLETMLLRLPPPPLASNSETANWNRKIVFRLDSFTGSNRQKTLEEEYKYHSGLELFAKEKR